MKELFSFCGKALRDRRAEQYARLDIDRLPDVLKQKLKSYANALYMILGGIILLLIYARLSSLIVAAAMVAWGLRQRSRIGGELDSRLKPYVERDVKSTGADNR